MSSAQDPTTRADSAQQLLGSLSGVISAHVVADATGDIVEIHVLSTGDLHPKQMVRNVESALSAGLGLQIDRRIVSVAQIRADVDSNGPEPTTGQATDSADADSSSTAIVHPPPGEDGSGDAEETTGATRHTTGDAPAHDHTRLEYVSYEAERDAEQCVCSVILRSGDDEVTGSGSGPDTAAGRAEAAARAVFHGIRQARPELEIELESAMISTRRDHDYVIVAAHIVRDRKTVPLAGAAPLARSPEEAAILAALQASNRWNA